MKQIIIAFSICTVFYCCNTANKEEPVIEKQISVQEKEMKDAIAKYPDSALLTETLIQYYQDNSNMDMAMAAVNAAIKKDSTNAKYWDKKGELFIINEDTTNAILCYQKAIKNFPDAQYIMSLGWLYAQKKNSDALSIGDSLLFGKKNAHAEKEAYLIKGIYYSAINKKQQALVFFDKCLTIDYTYMFAYREKAIVLYDTQKYNDALIVLQKAVTVQMKFDEGYYWMGKCYQKLNDKVNAIESYNTALKVNPDYVEAKDALAKLNSH